MQFEELGIGEFLKIQLSPLFGYWKHLVIVFVADDKPVCVCLFLLLCIGVVCLCSTLLEQWAPRRVMFIFYLSPYSFFKSSYKYITLNISPDKKQNKQKIVYFAHQVKYRLLNLALVTL